MSDISTASQSIIEGLKDGGCQYVNSYPGFKSHEIFVGLGGEFIALNERVAYEKTYGGSLAGKRSAITMKNVGINACLDPFLHSIINGINGGLVVILGDDTDVLSSPERQDSRPLRDVFGGLWLEPSTVQEAYDFSYMSFELSEKLDIPIVIRVTNQLFNDRETHIRKTQKKGSKTSNPDRSKYISYWIKRNETLKIKMKNIQNWVDSYYDLLNIPSSSSDNGVIISGCCTREIHSDKPKGDIFKVLTYPLPTKSLEKFISQKKSLTIFEQGNNYVEKSIQTLLSTIKSDISLTGNTGTPPNLEASWMCWDVLPKLFNALKKFEPSYVVGDEGQFTDEQTHSIHVCLCMGSSIGVAMGISDSGVEFPWAITGDASFLHCGMQSLQEANARGISLGVIVLDNGGAQSTDGQTTAGDIYGDLPISIKKQIVNYKDETEESFLIRLKEIKKHNSLEVLYVKY